MVASGGSQAEGTARAKACGGNTRDQFKEQQGGQCVWREASQGTVVGDRGQREQEPRHVESCRLR